MSNLFGNSILTMKTSLDYLWTKQSVTQNNIANVDTPGFKSGYVSFETEFKEKLNQAMMSGTNSQIQNVLSNASSMLTIGTNTNDGLRIDENNVNLEVEMVELAITEQQYAYALSALNSDISRLSTAIRGQ